MHAGDFNEGYRTHVDEAAETRDVKYRAGDALVGPSVDWSRFFSSTLKSYLSGTPISGELERADLAGYYSDDIAQQLSNTGGVLETAAFYNTSMTSHLNAHNFHTMNQHVGEAWRHLIDPEEFPAVDGFHYTAIQARLAVSAMKLVESRRTYDRKRVDEHMELQLRHAYLDRSFVGRITEIDAYIALLEVLKQQAVQEDSSLVALPAPSHFESPQNKLRAADLILIDPTSWQARGIQVKTRLQKEHTYDDTYVSYIDGITDLMNINEKKSIFPTEMRTTYPGLISADFLLNSPGLKSTAAFARQPEFSGMFGRIMHAKEIARTMEPAMRFPGRTERAAEKIGERILRELRGEPEQK